MNSEEMLTKKDPNQMAKFKKFKNTSHDWITS